MSENNGAFWTIHFPDPNVKKAPNVSVFSLGLRMVLCKNGLHVLAMFNGF